MTLLLNTPAPDVEVYRADGTPVALQTYWRARPIILTFLRHYGCQFCRQFLTMLRGGYPDIVAVGGGVIAIAQGSPPQAAHFANVYRIPFPILSDPKRSAYHTYGLNDGIFGQTLGPSVLLRMAGEAVQGNLPGVGDHVRALRSSDGSSLKQLGGTFIVGSDGTLRYAHIASPIYSHPTIEQLLAALISAR